MAQNIYDRADFFTAYSELPRSVYGLDGAPEWPYVRSILPDLNGLDIADLGCGFGWFSRFAREQGAASVTGYDLSENMLERARKETRDEAIRYVQADMEALELPEGRFDLVYSSLAFHYIRDFPRLLTTISRALRANGQFIFTIEHPIFMAPAKPGWMEGENGQKHWPIDHYAVEGERRTDWLADGVIKYHRRLSTTVNALIKAGFAIANLEEWRPSEEQIAAWPALVDELERPMLLIVSANK
ncbi:class I SAM-dependent methyltransferase [Brucella pseudogrignonensis]|jgi:ubiquinone/menaquinone biosynthesis C-methylase UbiE|uniref:Class I SAM-dependent methyltransferase n=1 Tax=Brucella pseudogrignonensis TaxID=419475 RepID=A0A1A9FHM2_9HYPH|nr:class I SAM-dependent methyltransferase [Brucella pseudogrignonensis]EMG55391.1 type 11 methyltransferase [Ochrobactrum sp. CDB2]QWK77777.1 class I SAM-dependent methyltransferase [Ochrobactrum sp. BTU1]ANG95066.1 SAM-dependent methyltransferase [Brucella pseudogrignonensis]KAB2690785.1 class I SAM-dependent methyltransferase [Brucella pseudogrignonensis]NNV21296.1 class I SAM-dependent methyltransferase [Brucella pseudogrignonensis]